MVRIGVVDGPEDGPVPRAGPPSVVVRPPLRGTDHGLRPRVREGVDVGDDVLVAPGRPVLRTTVVTLAVLTGRLVVTS